MVVDQIIKKIYKRIFDESLAPNVFLFLVNLKYAIFGYGLAAFCVFVFEIVAGRILGPEEYGKYVLVSSVAMFLYLFMTLGISTAAVKYNAEKEDYQRQRKIISTSYWATLIISFIFALLFFIFTPLFSRIFSIPLRIFYFAIIFAACYTLYILATDNLRGLHQIKKLSFFRASYGFLILIIFLIFLLNNHISFVTTAFSICFAYFIVFMLVTIKIRSYLYLRIDRFWLKNLLEYGIYVVGGSSLFIFLPILSKIMVNKYLTVTDVGIYNAYYFSSMNIALFFYTVFIMVFFPTASKYQQKEPIIRKIKKIILPLFLFGVPFLFLSQLVVLSFYGPKYPINYYLMFLFALSGILFIVYGFYSWLFYSKSVQEAKRMMALAGIIFTINIFLSIYFIPWLSLFGAVLAIISAYLIGIIYLFVSQKKLIN